MHTIVSTASLLDTTDKSGGCFCCCCLAGDPDTDGFLLRNSFHSMSHCCQSANDPLRHFLLPHRKHLTYALLTHTCAHGKPTTDPPTRTDTRKANSPAQAVQSRRGEPPSPRDVISEPLPQMPQGSQRLAQFSAPIIRASKTARHQPVPTY